MLSCVVVNAAHGNYSTRYGVGMPENDSDWRDAINLILQDMIADGTYRRIYDRWFGPNTSTPWPLIPDAPELWP